MCANKVYQSESKNNVIRFITTGLQVGRNWGIQILPYRREILVMSRYFSEEEGDVTALYHRYSYKAKDSSMTETRVSRHGPQIVGLELVSRPDFTKTCTHTHLTTSRFLSHAILLSHHVCTGCS
jgi:hypothetical protein